MRMLILAPVIALLAGSPPVLASGFPVTVQSCDRTVTFTAAPSRAIANDSNLTEMMLALGLADRMVGTTGFSGWDSLDPGLRAGVAPLPEISPNYPGREVILAADPDFYFAGWNYGFRVGGEVTPETLAQFGIATYELSESCTHVMDKTRAEIADLFTDLINLGRIFGVAERAETLVAQYRAELDAVLAALPPVPPVTVFVYDSGEDKPYTAGRAAMPNALIEAAGGVNLMDDVPSSWVQVGWEVVIERNPEVIVIVDYGEITAAQKIDFLKSNPALAEIDAVRNDRFVVLDYVEATPGPRNIAAIMRLAAAFRP